MVALEGVLSLQALRSAWSVATPVLSDLSSAAFPADSALRSGAALVLGTPFFLLVFRCVIVVLRRLGPGSRSGGSGGGGGGLQQPRLGFPLPVGLDEDAALDLYVIGLGAGVLGTCVPGLEVSGILLGRMLKECSAVWSVLALLVVVPGVYFSLGGLLSATSPAEGFVAHTRPTKAMWALCAAGHVILLAGCFYSPDVGRRVGFLLGLAHIVRLLQLAFSHPTPHGAGAGGATGVREEGIMGGAEL